MRQPSLLALVALLAACGGAPGPVATAPAEGAARAAVIRGTRSIPATWTVHSSPVTAPKAMVVSAHPLASAAGMEIIKQGGNAIDAAVAVGFALAVVLPDAGNIGGGGFIVHRSAAGDVQAIDYREMAPGGASHDMYLDSAGNLTEKSVTGHLASGVPGSVAGMYEAWKRHGSLPWATLLAPAIRLARDGHTVDGERSGDIKGDSDRLTEFPASRAQFLPGGHPPAPGTLWKQPDLARTLQLISDSGPDVFYRGQIAGLIVAEMQRGGGLITKDDLRRYRPKWRTPIQLSYRGYTIYSMPPASSGGVTMGEILNIMEGYDTLPAVGTAAYTHLLTEAMRRAFMDRNQWLGDPDFVDMPLERLLSKSYAAQLRGQIDPRRATPTPPQAASGGENMHTTHYSIVDTAGNAASVTTTLNNGFGSAVTVTGAGFLLNDEMDDFAAAPGKPNMYGLVQGEANAIVPGKRMLSAMTPSIVLDRDGQLFMVVGTPGGPTIITTVAQVILDVLDQKMTLAEAVAAPRVHHQALPDIIRYERGGLSESTVTALRGMGHHVEMRRGTSGIVAAIQRTPAGWVGVPDPRYAGGAVGW
ncbi:MAG TPA: gamma-glutamyltransferase [Gemmatimonadales bacterium]|jgi:gamma-glutamyltranspeptidase/glutathione hydrolase|nr:gamma-glutamyltransferase [Gemmatimonadales bacterium]